MEIDVMATAGTFTVYNATKEPISGFFSHKNNADEAIHVVDLASDTESPAVEFQSGAGTHDSWYWHSLSVGGIGDYKSCTGCAFYDKDDGKQVQIKVSGTGTDLKIEIVMPVSSNCGPVNA